MAKIAIGYRDRIADAVAISASSALSSLPAANLATPHLTRVWRTATGITTADIIVDLGAVYATGWTALANLNLSTTGTIRVRASATNPDVSSSLLYDSDTLSPAIDPAYRLFVHLFAGGSVSVRYLRLTLADPTLSHLQAGRWWAGRVLQSPRSSYDYGWQMLARDLSVRSVSETGQVYVEQRGIQRGVRLTLPSLTEADRQSHAEILQRLTSVGDDVMVMRDPDANNLARETIIGLLEELPAIAQPSFQRYSMTMTVFERL
jgi:hypothetical protein